ncbi:MAG: HAD hydrolase family protein [Armatimonadetes bacterium]|nr:HAD hydrolase family protein [Armatimonadota bacterium]
MPLFQTIRLIAMDCDGVLTDGSITYTERGDEIKTFDVADGLGLALARRAGLKLAVVTGRKSEALTRRARELGIEDCHQAVSDKAECLRSLMTRLGASADETAYIADDLNDLPAYSVAGFRIAVANAAPEIQAEAHYITQRAGGRGAVREAIETILKAQSRWQEAVRLYLAGLSGQP